MKNVILLRGSAGSGKSSVAKLFGGNVRICCADDFFMDDFGNYNFDPNLLGVAHAHCQRRFLDALNDPEIDTIVVANTNTKESDFKFYVDEAKKRDIMLFSLVVEKRHERENVHGVPSHVIDRHVENIKNSLKLK